MYVMSCQLLVRHDGWWHTATRRHRSSLRLERPLQQSLPKPYNPSRVRFDDSVLAAYLFEKWVEEVNSIEDPCLQVESNPIFEI